MKKNVLNFIILSLITISYCYGQTDTKELVRESFNKYKNAILSDKGEDAVNYVDSRTIAYYAKILETSKRADSITVSELGPLDKLMVLSIRHRTSKKDILSFDGKALLIYAIKEGMVGKNSVMNSSIGDVEIDGNFAKGQFITNGQKAPFHFHFYNENNQWKVDLTSVFPIGRIAFQKMIDDSGQDENQYFLMILEMITGKKARNKIWQPLE